MRIGFYVSGVKAFDRQIGQAFCRGAGRAGHQCELIDLGAYREPDATFDVIACIGVRSLRCFYAYRGVGRHAIYIDKGYYRHANPYRQHYYRMAVDAFQPLAYFQRHRPHDRLHALHWPTQPMRSPGQGVQIVIDGPSDKYCMLRGLTNMQAYVQDIIARIRQTSNRTVVYRPRLTFNKPTPVPGVAFSSPENNLAHALRGAYAFVTHGSNASVESLIQGVPVFVTGDAIATPLARTDLALINDPYYPSDTQRYQFLADLAYCQFTLDEFGGGLAWDSIKDELT